MGAGTWSAEFQNPYKVYIASIVQSSTSAPVATVTDNTIGAIVWARTGAGTYTATLSGAFTADKTSIAVGSADTLISGVRTSANVLTFSNTDLEDVAADGFTASLIIAVKA